MSRYKADVAEAKRRYPLIDAPPEELERRMEEDPSIAYRILYDMADIVKAAEGRALGVKRTGRRVKVRMSREQMERAALGPRPSMEPFPQALKELMNGRSQDQFARLMGISQSHLSKLLNEKKPCDREMCELAAKAGRVPPWYFREWRSMYVAEWMDMMLQQHPNISLTLLQHIPTPEYKAL